ncbi:MAG: DUF262 domain-containing protein [Sphingobacteriaceae bacterium]|nr:DUF262 domain-containing protein [Sphingobacteriaceae bacterium]
MSKLDIEQIDEIIERSRKNVRYDTKEFTLELLHSKFNRQIDENKSTEIFIPFYQRKFVWKSERQSKFIESILMGMPIPPMYFAEVGDGILEVIDGCQRINTVNEFLNSSLKLKGLVKLPELNGLTFNDLGSSRKRKINNVSLRAIVVTDIEIEAMNIRHEIFERLNTGGEALKSMEIKKGAKEGKFIKFIYDQCSDYTTFNELSDFVKQDELRAYKEEFIVKYFAFVDDINFEGYINDYLDNYIDDTNRKFDDHEVQDQYFIQFKTMLAFLGENNLVGDLSINRKNKLLAAYVGTTLALKEEPDLQPKPIFTKVFCKNAESRGFAKLKENILLVKAVLLG